MPLPDRQSLQGHKNALPFTTTYFSISNWFIFSIQIKFCQRPIHEFPDKYTQGFDFYNSNKIRKMNKSSNFGTQASWQCRQTKGECQ